MRRPASLACLILSACRPASATDRPAPAPNAADARAPSPPQAAAAPLPAPAPVPFPYGAPKPVAHYTCPSLLSAASPRPFLAAADARVAFIDGDDLLALVNRSPTGALPPSYIPSDLVDVRDGTAHSEYECESGRNCLRRDAAGALRRMLDQMRTDGVRGLVQSAFRGFGTQCWVFANWAHEARGGFCEATAQSALPGHSQHQLGTTVDLFTKDWAERGAKLGQGVFRNGFGCSDGGRWLDEKAWQYGFLVSYPIDPDDRKDGSRCQARPDRSVPIDPKTGYKHEPWHLRFIGVDAAARYHDAWLASGPGSPREITLEQWIRAQRGLVGDAELPVCDGCSCGACATLADGAERAPCGDASLRLDASGRVQAPSEEPRLIEARVSSAPEGVAVIAATVHSPAHTPTQTPVIAAEGPTYQPGETFDALVPYPEAQPHAYAGLPGAWRLAVETVPPAANRWPWQGSLAKSDLGATWNRANIVLPARAGDAAVLVRVALPAGVKALRVTLLRDGQEHDTRQLDLP